MRERAAVMLLEKNKWLWDQCGFTTNPSLVRGICSWRRLVLTNNS